MAIRSGWVRQVGQFLQGGVLRLHWHLRRCCLHTIRGWVRICGADLMPPSKSWLDRYGPGIADCFLGAIPVHSHADSYCV